MSDIHGWFDDIDGRGAIRDALEKMDRKTPDTENIDWNAETNWEIFTSTLRHLFCNRGEPYSYARRGAIEAIMGFDPDCDFATRMDEVAAEILADGDELISFEVRRGNRILSSNRLLPKEVEEMDGGE